MSTIRTTEQITAEIIETVREFNSALAVEKRTERYSYLDQGLIAGISDQTWEFGRAREKRDELLVRARNLAFESLHAGMNKRATGKLFGSMAEFGDVRDVLS